MPTIPQVAAPNIFQANCSAKSNSSAIIMPDYYTHHHSDRYFDRPLASHISKSRRSNSREEHQSSFSHHDAGKSKRHHHRKRNHSPEYDHAMNRERCNRRDRKRFRDLERNRDHDRDLEHDRDRDRDHKINRERCNKRDRERLRDLERNRDHDRDHERCNRRDRERDRSRHYDSYRKRDKNRGRNRSRERTKDGGRGVLSKSRDNRDRDRSRERNTDYIKERSEMHPSKFYPTSRYLGSFEHKKEPYPTRNYHAASHKNLTSNLSTYSHMRTSEDANVTSDYGYSTRDIVPTHYAYSAPNDPSKTPDWDAEQDWDDEPITKAPKINSSIDLCENENVPNNLQNDVTLKFNANISKKSESGEPVSLDSRIEMLIKGKSFRDAPPFLQIECSESEDEKKTDRKNTDRVKNAKRAHSNYSYDSNLEKPSSAIVSHQDARKISSSDDSILLTKGITTERKKDEEVSSVAHQNKPSVQNHKDITLSNPACVLLSPTVPVAPSVAPPVAIPHFSSYNTQLNIGINDNHSSYANLKGKINLQNSKEYSYQMLVNDSIVKLSGEVKQILQRDLSKKMFENTSLKNYESWWDEQMQKARHKINANFSDGNVSTISNSSHAPRRDMAPDINKLINNHCEVTNLKPFAGLGLMSSISKLPSFRRIKKQSSPKRNSDIEKHLSDQEEMVQGSDSEKDDIVETNASAQNLLLPAENNIKKPSNGINASQSTSSAQLIRRSSLSSFSSSSSSSDDEDNDASSDDSFASDELSVISEDDVKTKKKQIAYYSNRESVHAKNFDSDSGNDDRGKTKQKTLKPDIYSDTDEEEPVTKKINNSNSKNSCSNENDVLSDLEDISKDSTLSEDGHNYVSKDTVSSPFGHLPKDNSGPHEKEDSPKSDHKTDNNVEDKVETKPAFEENLPQPIENEKLELAVSPYSDDTSSQTSQASQVALEHCYSLPPQADLSQISKTNTSAYQQKNLAHDHGGYAKKPMSPSTNACLVSSKPGPVRPRKDSPRVYVKEKGQVAPSASEFSQLLPIRPKETFCPQLLFGPRSESDQLKVQEEYFKKGIDLEDIQYIRKCYEKRLNADRTGYWLSNVPWVDHCVTARSHLPPMSKRRKKEDELKRHVTESARTEGYYKIDFREKAKHKYHHAKANVDCSSIVECNDDQSLPLNNKLISKMQGISGEGRSIQRRLLTAFGLTGESELLKFNQLKFRKKQLKVAKSGIHDRGLFAMEPIAADEMVIEYVGQMIRPIVADLRETKYEAIGIGSSYLLRIDNETIIDATKSGNLARFINHSCKPNCYAKVITIESEKKIVIYSKQPISVNEEITYGYKFSFEEKKIPCLCGAQGCRGTIN